MDPFNTENYKLERKEDGTLVRVDGLGGETPEMTVDYYDSQIAFHTQIIANLEAQKLKVEEFEVENPPIEIPEPEAAEETSEETTE